MLGSIHMQGDLKQDQKDMYKEMKAALNTDFIVAFNKVDVIEPNTYTNGCKIREYFKAQRTKTSLALGCHEDKIHYLCLNPDSQLHTRFEELKKEGIFGFEDFYGEVKRNAKKWQKELL